MPCICFSQFSILSLLLRSLSVSCFLFFLDFCCCFLCLEPTTRTCQPPHDNAPLSHQLSAMLSSLLRFISRERERVAFPTPPDHISSFRVEKNVGVPAISEFSTTISHKNPNEKSPTCHEGNASSTLCQIQHPTNLTKTAAIIMITITTISNIPVMAIRFAFRNQCNSSLSRAGEYAGKTSHISHLCC